ncbi:MAG TPA: DUF4956 domain-containing protein, partial [Chitinophagales bacterium]|nr:DUF4956 domain-containing protein [Chitinophagales bacterium]
LALDFATLFVIIALIYYPRMKDKDYLFTFFVFNLLIFLVCHFMNSMQLSLGLGFGLFALFAILRYRTITVPIKEMTYLFTVITIAIINSLGSFETAFTEIIIANAAIIALIYVLERVWQKTQQGFKVITYEKIEMIKPENHRQLLDDLRLRTGLDITAIDIDSINFLNDTCVIKLYYNIHDEDAVRRVVERNAFR